MTSEHILRRPILCSDAGSSLTSSSICSFLAGAEAAVQGLRAELLPSDADLVILRVCLDSVGDDSRLYGCCRFAGTPAAASKREADSNDKQLDMCALPANMS